MLSIKLEQGDNNSAVIEQKPAEFYSESLKSKGISSSIEKED